MRPEDRDSYTGVVQRNHMGFTVVSLQDSLHNTGPNGHLSLVSEPPARRGCIIYQPKPLYSQRRRDPSYFVDLKDSPSPVRWLCLYGRVCLTVCCQCRQYALLVLVVLFLAVSTTCVQLGCSERCGWVWVFSTAVVFDKTKRHISHPMD